MKAGFVGFAPGAAGTLGAGSSAGALGASLAGPTVSGAALGTAGTTGLLGDGGAFLSGGSLLTGSALVPGSTGTVASSLIPASVKGKVGVVSASVGGVSGPMVPISTTTFGGVGGLIPTTTAVKAGGAALGTPAASAAISTAAKSGAGKSGFLNGLKNTLIDGVKSGTKNLVATGMYNLVMHGDIKGPEFEQDLYGGGGGRAGSYTGSYALPDAIRFTQQGLGSDTIGSTYVNMLQNLNYGTGSLDYARHTNMSLMRGIQVPQIQYA